MQLTLRDDLPFTRIGLTYAGNDIEIDDVLVYTGSATTVLAAHAVADVGIQPEMEDMLVTIRGVGGTETVYIRRVQAPRIGQRVVENTEIEIGGMNYGFRINGVLGMDILIQTGAIIDLGLLTVELR